MPVEKFYCGNCGSVLYFGQRFKEHTLIRPCPVCQRPNPLYFHFCYRCGARITAPDSVEEDDTR